jgi:hypothetical protein
MPPWDHRARLKQHAWSKRQRDEYVQALADRFVPDEEPPF